jgi:hypothetical protein
MAANFALGLPQGPNAGDRFASAFQQGMQMNAERAKRQAMAALMANPNDPKALADLARMDPSTAMDFRKQQLEYTKTQLAQHQDSIIKGAQILRQFQPKDQASYTAALQAAQQAGVDISQVPQEFNPEYVNGVIHIADALKPEAGAQDPGIIREYTVAKDRGLIPPDTSYTQYVTLRNPGSQTPVILPHNITQVGGGAAVGGAPITATGPNGQKLRLNPQTNQWEPMGGGGGNATGGFPPE